MCTAWNCAWRAYVFHIELSVDQPISVLMFCTDVPLASISNSQFSNSFFFLTFLLRAVLLAPPLSCTPPMLCQRMAVAEAAVAHPQQPMSSHPGANEWVERLPAALLRSLLKLEW